MFKGDRVSDLQNEKVLETGCTTMQIYLTLLNYTLKYREDGKFYITCICHTSANHKVQTTFRRYNAQMTGGHIYPHLHLLTPRDAPPRTVPEQHQSHHKPVPELLLLEFSYEQVMFLINEVPINIQFHNCVPGFLTPPTTGYKDAVLITLTGSQPLSPLLTGWVAGFRGQGHGGD